MAASVEIVLDTVAPEISLGAAVRPLPDRVEIPFTTSPDTQEILATVDIFGDGSVPASVDGSKLVATGITSDAVLLTLHVSAEDDVGNISLTSEDYQISVFTLAGRISIGPALRAYIRVLPYYLGKLHVGTGLASRVVITHALRLSGQVKKILTAALKIDQGDR